MNTQVGPPYLLGTADLTMLQEVHSAESMLVPEVHGSALIETSFQEKLDN